MVKKEGAKKKGLILVTGAAGAVGTAITGELEKDWTVVGLDLFPEQCTCEAYKTDLTDPASVETVLQTIRERHGIHVVSVIHLAAYFDFSGEDHPLYQALNVEGTRNLLRALQRMDVGQFVYSGTMLVHRPARPGERIDESAPVEPKFIYPRSKARAEEVIREAHGGIPCVSLRLAGLYDACTGVPTLTHQIARIYERSPKARLYSGDLSAGQALVHSEDMVAAFRLAVEKRESIPDGEVILIGEPETPSYRDLQNRIGRLIHGEKRWRTITVPKPYARAGAWLETKSEPVIPDQIDRGEKPFIRPFMVDMSDDHYALDITHARELLGWEPRHRIADTLPKIVAALKKDPLGWYRKNGITPPYWLERAAEASDDPEALRAGHEAGIRREHQRFLWARFATVALGIWLIGSAPSLGYESRALMASDVVSGAAIAILGALTLSWRLRSLRWVIALLGAWLLFAPLVFAAPTAASYLNGTLVGAMVIGFSLAIGPPPGIGLVAQEVGPDVPPGWDFSPSSWLLRAPIIALALVGLLISRHLAAYQLGHIDAAWEPFFQGSLEGLNGTEQIVTSRISEAWPVSDAGLGAVVYMLEILIGLTGGINRWRTMPWLVALFALLIIPLGAVSIFFIIIQPILIGTWCTLCLVGAAAMLVQIPYASHEVVATAQFLRRRYHAGAPLLRVFFAGDAHEPEPTADRDDFELPADALLRRALGQGMGMPWTLALTIAIGAWLMLTRLTLGADGAMADADHLIGALVITVAVIALAEPLRPVRLLVLPLGAALIVTSLFLADSAAQMVAGLVAALAMTVLALPPGRIRHRWGGLERWLY